MLVTSAGRIWGTVGGGAVEHHSEGVAAEVLRSKKPRLEYFRLRENEIQDLGMICGGDVNVHFQYISADDEQKLVLIKQIGALYQTKEGFWLVSEISEDGEGGMAVCRRSGAIAGISLPAAVFEGLQMKPVLIETEGRKFYCENMQQQGRVYIFGEDTFHRHWCRLLQQLILGVWFWRTGRSSAGLNCFPGQKRSC